MYRITLILLFSLFSCESIKEKQNSLQNIKTNPNENTIKRTTDLFENIEFIPIKSREKILLGTITKIISNNDLFVLLQEFPNRAIYTINGDGDILYELTNENYIQNFSIDKDEILVYFSDLKTLMRYDLHTGEEISILGTNQEFRGRDFIIDNNKIYWFNDGEDSDIKYNLIITDLGLNIEKKFLRYQGESDIISRGRNFYKNNGTISFNYGLNDTIYQLRAGMVKSKVFVDFGNQKFDNKIKSETLFDIYQSMKNNGGTGYITEYCENDKHIVFGYSKNLNFRLHVEDKVNNKNFNVIKLEDDFGLGLNFPVLLDGSIPSPLTFDQYGNLIGMVFPRTLFKNSTNEKHLKKYLIETEIDDNPILIRFKWK